MISFRSSTAIAIPVLLIASLGTLSTAQNTPPPAPVAVKMTADQVKFFETSIRPLLSEKCFSCHSATDQRGGLRLDSREAILKGSSGHGAVVSLTDPDHSIILQVISYTGKVQMPPPGKLRPAELAALTAWVKMGAPWPADKGGASIPSGQAPDIKVTPSQKAFWSFVPVKKPSLPKVKNTAWAATPIDRLVLAKLEAAGLKPARFADRRTLIRRVSVDLTGLVPSPNEVEAFVNDKSPDAWAKVVDRLLASSQYGERWARHWLDLVRYADSNGLDENVAFANSYRYRDYVVNALNSDKPYNTFVTEQLAGDLIPARDDIERNEHLIATGFLELGPKVLAEPDKDKMVMDIVDEQIDVATKSFIGLTVACARCHNHKFDPIPTRDYYALAGIFKSTKTMATLNTVAMWEEKSLVSESFKAETVAYTAKLDALKQAEQAVRRRGNDVLASDFTNRSDQYLIAGWLASRSSLHSLADSTQKFAYKKIVEAENYNRSEGIAKDFDGYGKGIGVIHSVGAPCSAEWDVDVQATGNYQVELRYASGEKRPVKLIVNGKVVRESTAGTVTGGFFPDAQKWEPQGVFPFVAGKNTIRIERPGDIPHFDKVLIVSSPVTDNGHVAETPEQIAAERGLNLGLVLVAADVVGNIATDPSSTSGSDRAAAAARMVSKFSAPRGAEKYYSPELTADLKKAVEMVKAAEAAAPVQPMAMAAEEGKVEDCRVHIRGDTQSLGDSVPRHFLTVLSRDQVPAISAKESGRLQFANWLTRTDNPLTARVAVNRIWQEHFGEGLSKTPDNFGLLGDRPLNQPLMDWLAATFMEQGWSIKRLHRTILLSNTYKMSCTPDATAVKIAETADPDNRLLWKMPRRRMDADAFRDSILKISGNLDLTMGGSLLMTKNHDYVTNDQSANAAVYDSPRRSLYLPIIRNALFDMFQAFDMGDPSMVNASRNTTTVSPQALFVMNSMFMLNQSKALATKQLLADGGTDKADVVADTQRIKLAYLKVYARPPTQVETAKALRYINKYTELVSAHIIDAKLRREAAWSSWCQVLFASNAFIYID